MAATLVTGATGLVGNAIVRSLLGVKQSKIGVRGEEILIALDSLLEGVFRHLIVI